MLILLEGGIDLQNRSFSVEVLLLTIYFLFIPQSAYAMHIMEGFLPVKWAAFWWVLSTPFFLFGVKRIRIVIKENPQFKLLLGVIGAFTFALSALKLPSVTGSSSHMTGVGLGAILFGPAIMSVIGGIVLLFQALLLAHGGITTLGANLFSMAITGPIFAVGTYHVFKRLLHRDKLAIFLAASLGDLMTYVVTSLQLSLAFPSQIGGVMESFQKFFTIFAVTQVPLAMIEGIITVIVIQLLKQNHQQELQFLLQKERRFCTWGK